MNLEPKIKGKIRWVEPVQATPDANGKITRILVSGFGLPLPSYCTKQFKQLFYLAALAVAAI